jgi:hypothetical protein
MPVYPFELQGTRWEKSANSAWMVIVRSQFSLDLQHLQTLQHLYRLAAGNLKQELEVHYTGFNSV